MKHPYYSFDKILSYNAMFMFIAGARGLGKTYGAQKLVIRKALKAAVKDGLAGDQFMYVRRYKDELKLAKNTFFDAVRNEFPAHDFRINGQEAQSSHVKYRNEKNRLWVTIGHFMALSVAQQAKSVAYPNVKTIIFDEFILEKGYVHYIANEWEVFLNLYKTVDRDQDKTKVLLLANSVSMMNPYFIALGIEPDQVEQEIVIRHNGYVAVHFPDAEDFSMSVSKTRFGKFIAGTDYEKFAVRNKFADANTEMLGAKYSSARYQYTLETSNGSLSVWKEHMGDEFFISSKLPKSQIIFTMVPEKQTHDKTLLFRNDKILQYLRSAFSTGKVTFDKASTRNIITEIFKR